jgi:hypothetical protein
MSSYVPTQLRRLVVERAEGICEYCLIAEEDTFLGCQIEHVISEKHGGSTTADNLALACVFCNRSKGTDVATLVGEARQLVRLFNPRTDRWSEHFELRGSRVEGKTEIGKGTSALLAFNHPDRILEREELIRSRRYPSEKALRKI